MVPKKIKELGVLSLVLLNFSVVVGLRGLPLLASYGISSIFFYAIAAVCFLIPISLVCAELATGWPKSGGVYGWAKEAFGEKFGFLTVWLQWAPNILWYPIALSFFAATFSFIFVSPSITSSPWFIPTVIISVYWIATVVNLRGFELAKNLTSVLTVVGVMLPAFLVIFFALDWLRLGQPSYASLDLSAIIPTFTGIGSIAFAIGVFSSYSGMEVHAVRAMNLRNPAKDYPKAIFISAILAFVFFSLGTLSIAILVPSSQLNLMTGLMEAAKGFLSAFSRTGLVPVIASMICLGLVGQVVSWISGPSKGLLIAAKNGNLPKFFSYQNENGVQSNILFVQGIAVTLVALLFLVFRSTELFYWFLTDLYTHLYLIMYLLLFAAAIKLRYSQPNAKRAFSIPGGKLGVWLVAGVGFVSTLAGFIVGFFPPAGLPKEMVFAYEAVLFVSILLIGAMPLAIYKFRKSWVPANR
jgi:amino acid transporter